MNASRESTGCLLPPPTPVGEEGSHCRRHDGAGRRHLADRLESHVRGVDRRSRAPRIGDGDSLSCVTGVCRRRGSPRVRATALGVYRFWRDLGYAVGALLSGLVADLLGMAAPCRGRSDARLGSPCDAADAGDIADQTAESGRDLVCGKRQLERRASTEFAGCVNQDSDRD